MVFVEMDLSKFPKKLELKYGRDKNGREWYEWAHGGKAVVIQRTKPQRHWCIYFIHGKAVRVVQEELTMEAIENGVIAQIFEGTLDDCIKALKSLGFSVKQN